ncbi:hypothetical protein DPEC_G00262220 [Dallia pectoralis]|uniref:Uncharacterized protein n=1 Tax=Dallia pectoralis TaxID=75939 RepID=A0ACC2FS77_DALPE|nr:hypothetical protein DPEC_G00262220 [Dallia pectoralis]
MANALVGTLTAFDSQTQTWEEYVEVLGHFFVANEIEDGEKKRAILLSSVGSRTYSLMRTLLSPDKPGERSYGELTDLLQSHFNPKPSEIVQRFKFNSRKRAAKEIVAEYVAVLRELAHHCSYGDKQKEMLRDRLVCGIADDRIQRRLLAEPELTFEKALKVALAMETASRYVRDLQLQALDGSVHISVFEKNRIPQVERCTVCCTEHHCPICPTSVYKPRCRSKVLQHMEVHVKNAIQYEELFITKCHQACRSGCTGGHFHCPFCSKTVLKRQDTVRHLKLCRQPLNDRKLDADADCREMGTSQTAECKGASVDPPRNLTTDKLPAFVHSRAMDPPCRLRRPKLPTVHCPHCNVAFLRKNIRKHIYRRHNDKAHRDIAAKSHLDAVCIDETNGIYAVTICAFSCPQENLGETAQNQV